jgi:hypothetical protein
MLPRRHHYLRALRLRPRPELPSDLVLCNRPATRQQHAGGQQQRGRSRRGRPMSPSPLIRPSRHWQRHRSLFAGAECMHVQCDCIQGSWKDAHKGNKTKDALDCRRMSGVCCNGGSVFTARARAWARAPNRPPRRPGLVRGRARVPTIRDGPHSQMCSAWWL